MLLYGVESIAGPSFEGHETQNRAFDWGRERYSPRARVGGLAGHCT
jgi:hypothetical protein